MVTKNIYISGPMTGLPEFNYPAFHKATETFEALGYNVYNPARDYQYEGNLESFPIRDAFKYYCRFITEVADEIHMLRGWEKSVGARAEHALAIAIGIKVSYQ